MSSNSTVEFENHQHFSMMNSDTGVIPVDQGGEWDIILFNELENLEDADKLFEALEYAGFASDIPDLDIDIDLATLNTGNLYADGEVSVDSLSPAHTLSSVSSPASVEPLSPYSSDEVLSPQSQASVVSVCSDSSGFSEIPPPAKRAPKNSQATRVRPAQPVKRPIQFNPKVSIQPKPVITTVPLAHTIAPLQTKTIIIQSLETTVVPVVKPASVSIQPALPPGKTMVVPQSGQVFQTQTPQAVTGHVVNMPTLSQKCSTPFTGPPMVSVSIRTPSDDDSKVLMRQQRMMRNREAASLSRKKKKEHLLMLEARLKVALTENEVLKHENCNLKRQLEGLLSENTVLKSTAPKRKAVCLMVVLVFLVLSVGPMSVFQGGPSSTLPASSMHSSRHLLGFSPETEGEVSSKPLGSSPPQTADSSEDKALMVVKDPVFLRPSAPCQPPINKTKSMELAHELKGWVHRHEVEQTKSRRMSKAHHKPTRTILKTDAKEENVAQIVTVQYTETLEDNRNPGNELQVYYAPHRTYSDFFDEINRRRDTFYIVSFRRDHLLLPATSHNKGSRPKMSVVLPAMNTNDSVIRDEEFQVMMQIDCEVTDTRILHIRSSSIPPLLRVNRTDYQSPPPDSQPMPPVGVLMGSA